MQEPSIFARIVSGEIPCHKIYEDDKTFAFLDIHPQVPGHTLVIPKTQIEFLWDLSEEDYEAVMNTCKKLALHLRERLNTRYVGVKVVGTDVPHVHVHLIPFDRVDEYTRRADLTKNPDHEALAAMAQKLAF
jgi:histidine triad (HIT) family protein